MIRKTEQPVVEAIEFEWQLPNLLETVHEITSAHEFILDGYATEIGRLVEAFHGNAAILWATDDGGEIYILEQFGVRILEDEPSEIIDEQYEWVTQTLIDATPDLLESTEPVEPIFLGRQTTLAANPSSEQTPQADFDQLTASHRQMLIPIIVHDEPVGVLSIFQSGRQVAESPWTLSDLAAITQRIQFTIQQRLQAELDAKFADQERLLSLAKVIGRNVHEKPTAYDVVNELRNYLGHGRVSLAAFRGTSCKIHAVSNQPLFDRRSNVIKKLERLAAPVGISMEPIWHPEDDEQLPLQASEAFEEYYEVADTRSVALIPLVRYTTPPNDPNNLKAIVHDFKSTKGKCVGVIIVEGLDETLGRDELGSVWQEAEPLVTNAVARSHEYSGLFLMPLWRRLGVVADLYRGHHKRIAFMVTAALFLAVFALTMLQTDFTLRSKGILQPQQRSQLFAQTTGVINEVFVEDGQTVYAGQPLASIDNPELLAEIATIEGQLNETKEQLRTVILQRTLQDFRTKEEREEAIRTTATLEPRLKSLERQFKLLQDKQKTLNVTSPVDGRVTTWNTSQRLHMRPVNPGDKLMVVANSSGPWEVELRVPDKRAGYLLEAWKKANLENETLSASFVLASEPRKVHAGVVQSVAPAADVDEKDGNVIRVVVTLDDTTFPETSDARPGTEVIGHVHVGRRSVGYCKLYEFFDWTRRTWFTYF